ncbi:MAG: Crp/Fnr family transcriptional regulator [Alistipes sp.]|jgi:CRP-like cAMP-binding protein|nr:Crp/Fnr family transcriptional regulator [Alistipes sp.]
MKNLLDAECSYRMRDDTMDSFIGLMSEVKLKRNKVLIPYGECDNNVYVVKEGIIRFAYFDGFDERTFSFALPGTLLVPYYSFCRSEPSFCKLEACCESVVMKIAKSQFVDLASRSHDFAQWMMYMSLEQLMFHEKKLEIMNGNAQERFEALIENRPEIIENVSSRVIASYIGITQQYLSTLKQQFGHKLKK